MTQICLGRPSAFMVCQGTWTRVNASSSDRCRSTGDTAVCNLLAPWEWMSSVHLWCSVNWQLVLLVVFLVRSLFIQPMYLPCVWACVGPWFHSAGGEINHRHHMEWLLIPQWYLMTELLSRSRIGCQGSLKGHLSGVPAGCSWDIRDEEQLTQ